MFKNKLKNYYFSSHNVFKSETLKLKLKILQSKVNLWNEKAAKIQTQFNFILPSYLIDEIIDQEHCKNYSNLYSLINLAVLTNKLSKENGKILKRAYSTDLYQNS